MTTTTSPLDTLPVGTRVHTTATVGRGTSVHVHGAEVIERHGRKSLVLRGHAMCAQPSIRSGSTKTSGPVTCKRCLSYDDQPEVI